MKSSRFGLRCNRWRARSARETIARAQKANAAKMPEAETYHSEVGFAIGIWHNVVFVDVEVAFELPQLQKLGDAYRDQLRRYPEGIAAIVMLRPGAPVASSQGRAESTRFMKEFGATVRVGLVLEDRGLLAVIMRSVVRTSVVLARNMNLLVFDAVESALPAMAEYVSPSATSGPVSVTAMGAALRAFRSRFVAAPRVSLRSSG